MFRHGHMRGLFAAVSPKAQRDILDINTLFGGSNVVLVILTKPPLSDGKFDSKIRWNSSLQPHTAFHKAQSML